MSEENIELLREMFRRAVEQRDRTAVQEILDPDVIWMQGEDIPSLAGVYRGQEGVRQFFSDWVEAFQDYRAKPEEFIDAGEHVVVAVRHHAWGKASGVEVEMAAFQVWTLRDRKVVRFESFPSRHQALEAAGLSE